MRSGRAASDLLLAGALAGLLSACTGGVGAVAAPTAVPSAVPGTSVPLTSVPTMSVPAVPTLAPTVQQPGSPALALLARLRVQGRGPSTGYVREAFGAPWLDADRNGCDTRNDVLRRDLADVVLKPGTHGCVVLRGTLTDPYTGRAVAHERGNRAVEIDHVVSLSDAWQTGAARWSWAQRVALANDPLELQATATAVNRAKGGSDAASWLPPDRRAWCPFAARQVAVKAKYGLGVTRAERDALQRVLGRCPDQPAPTSTAPTVAPLRSPAPG